MGDVADAFVAAVCRPQDVEDVRATVARLDPEDLAGLVAAVDEHQPMTLEVAVDVLAELGVAASGIATAVGVDVEDVRVLLGSPLGGPPPSVRHRDARIIEVVGGGGVGAESLEVVNDPVVNDPVWDDPLGDDPLGDDPVGDDVDVPTSDESIGELENDPGDDHGDDPGVDPGDDLGDDPAHDHGGGADSPADGQDPDDEVERDDDRPAADRTGDDVVEAGPAILRIDEVADADHADRVAADLEDAAATGSHRGRAWFAVLLFVLLVVGALVVAWQLGAF